MPKKVLTRTGKAGDTANDRRIVSVGELPGDTTGTAWAAPSQSGDGFLLQRNEFIHLFSMLNRELSAAEEDPASYYTVQIWWYTPISGYWHMGESLTINADDVATIEVQGFDRVYVQVTSVSFDTATYSGTPTLEMWLGLVVPV